MTPDIVWVTTKVVTPSRISKHKEKIIERNKF